MLILRILVGMLAGVLVVFPLYAADSDSDPEHELIRQKIASLVEDAPFEIKDGPINGVYEVLLGGQIIYVYQQGDHLLIGELYDTVNRVNYAEAAEQERVAGILAEIPTEDMIVFGPADAERHITVFTDVSCPYCRKLQEEVPTLTEAGLQVRYLAFPRAGIGSKDYNSMVSVWCSEDQQTAMSKAMEGAYAATLTCDNPVADQYELGGLAGVRGTPTIIVDDGTVIPGYMPAAEMLERMGLN
jgi:thiol:disulfide interchange protein DsbC